MPFFDKLTKNFENLLSDDKKKEKTETHGDDDKHRGNASKCSLLLFTWFVNTMQSDLLVVKTRDIFPKSLRVVL